MFDGAAGGARAASFAVFKSGLSIVAGAEVASFVVLFVGLGVEVASFTAL